MNRRNFLKSLGAACGAAVVAPAVLLESKPKSILLRGKQGCVISGTMSLGVRGGRSVASYDEFQHTDKELTEKMKQAFRNTKFKRPMPYNIRGDRSKFFYICQKHLRHGLPT